MVAPAFMTVKEAAEYCCVSESLVYAWLKQRKIPALRLGARGRGCWRIQREDLDGFLAASKIGELPPPDDGGGYTYLR